MLIETKKKKRERLFKLIFYKSAKGLMTRNKKYWWKSI